MKTAIAGEEFDVKLSLHYIMQGSNTWEVVDANGKMICATTDDSILWSNRHMSWKEFTNYCEDNAKKAVDFYTNKVLKNE